MKKRVLAIAANSKYSHSSLALRYFRENSGCDIFECSINDDIFNVYAKLTEMNYEVLCFSVYIWNVEFVLKLIPMLINAKPETKIILGGPEAGYNYVTLLKDNKFINGIICGEGEDAISAIVNSCPLNEIPNIAYRCNGEIVCNTLKKVSLNNIKFPYREDDIDELKNKIVYFETSRGCCFNCSYCLSSSEGNTRYFDMKYVEKGLKYFIDNDFPLVKFVDRTFNENDKRACEILKFIIKNNKNTRFHFEVSPLLLSGEFCGLLEQMKDYVQLEIGIQTTNCETMRHIRRVFDINDIKTKLSMIPSGIHVHMDLIAGLPGETLESFINGFNYVFSLKPDMLQLGFLKLLHNTKLKDEAENFGIMTTVFPPYEVISTNSMSAEDIILLKKIERAVDKFYNSSVFPSSMLFLTRKSVMYTDAKVENTPFEIFKKIGLELYEREKSGPLSRSQLYLLLYELYGDSVKNAVVNDFVVNNPNLKIPEEFLSEKDKNADLKQYRKIILECADYKDLKFKLTAAGGQVFVISNDKIEILDELKRKFPEISKKTKA